MTHEIPRDANTPPDEQDFAALADQWAEKNWYLPPGGDQSWREREAQRRFGVDNSIPDGAEASPAAADDPGANEIDGPYEPAFKRPLLLNILLPVSLATCAVFLVIFFLMPGILRSGFWGPREPKMSSSATFNTGGETVAVENVTPRLVENESRGKIEGVSQALPRPIGEITAPPKAEVDMVAPRLRPQMPVAAKDDGQSGNLVVRAVKALPPRVMVSKMPAAKPAAKSLPPIGAAYFASHASVSAAKEQAATSSRPIGQTYFESRSATTAN